MAAARLSFFQTSQTAWPLSDKAATATALQLVDTSTSKVQVLIVCHVHRLYPIKREVDKACQTLPGVRIGVVYAGMPLSKNKAMLHNSQPHVLLGTMGRIQSLVSLGLLQLAEEPQLLMDSMPGDKEDMVGRKRPLRALLDRHHQGDTGAEKRARAGAATPTAPSHHHLSVAAESKDARLCEYLDLMDFEQVIIFTKSPARASEVTATLVKRGLSAVAIHASLTEKMRAESREAFCGFQQRILVTTDELPRLRTERVNLVVCYDAPTSSATYWDRAGHLSNTAAAGSVVTLIEEEETTAFKEVRWQLGIPFAAALGPNVNLKV